MPFRNAAALLLALFLVLSLASCSLLGGKEEEAENPGEEELDPDYPVSAAGATLEERPGAVVSLSPSLTEKICDLGLEDRLAGVSEHCDYPSGVAGLARCGTALLPDLEELDRLGADLVLVDVELPDGLREELEGLGIQAVSIPRPAQMDVPQWKDSYRDLALLLEGAVTGKELGDEFAEGTLQGRLDLLQRTFGGGQVPVLYLRMMDFTVATGDSLESRLLEQAGLVNIAAGQSDWSYPQELAQGEGRGDFESLEFLFLAKGDVTITMLEQSAFYSGLQATIQDRYLEVDSVILERQSLRTLDLVEEMARAAHGGGSGGQASGSEEEDGSGAGEADGLSDRLEEDGE